jgi:EmrB/QacA subfamily drug resistance transporter
MAMPRRAQIFSYRDGLPRKLAIGDHLHNPLPCFTNVGAMYQSSHLAEAKKLSETDGQNRPVRRALVFTIVGLALIMSSVDSTIVATALHALQKGLQTSINWVGWTLTAYSFGLVLMLPVSGKLSARYGHRRVFLGSVAVFTAASLGCGMADNIYALIVLRAIQAAGGAGFTPSATGIVVDHFGKERDRALGLFGSLFPIGAMIGPVFGGLFVSYWSWRGVFYVNVPIGLVGLVLALRYVPRDRPAAVGTGTKLDVTGMTLLGSGLLAGMVAASYLGEGNAHPWSLALLVPLAIAIVALWIFFRHGIRSAHPFIAPHMIHGPGFGPVNLLNALYGGVSGGVMALVPLYATNRYAIDALGSGTLLVAQGVATIIVSVLATLVMRRTGYRLPMYIGNVTIIAGLVLLAVSPPAGITPYAWLAGSAFLVGVGNGAVNPASRNAGLQLDPLHSSTIAALRSLSRQIGAIVAISAATAVLANSSEPGNVQSWVYIVAGLLVAAALPLISRIPDHHGSW